jgi:TatD DNase family protein
MLIDTHVHLDAHEFDADRDEVVRRAAQARIERLVIPAVEVGNFDTVQALSESISGACHAYGIHPLCVMNAGEDALKILRQRLEAGDAMAVGEIGIDGFVEGLDMDVQEHFFVEQLKLAREFDLPVLVHVRRAQDRVLKYLRRIRPLHGIAHAFNGSPQQAQTFVELGFALGFGGAMTYTGSTRIRALAASVPLDHIVLESDAPDIPPAWIPGGRNEPANVARFAEVLAQLRACPVDEIIRATGENACRVLGLE